MACGANGGRRTDPREAAAALIRVRAGCRGGSRWRLPIAARGSCESVFFRGTDFPEVLEVPIATINPATGELLKAFDPLPPDQIDQRLARADAGFAELSRTTFAQRGVWMARAAEILDAEIDTVAALMTTEMGKTLASAKAEVAKCAKACRYFAEHAQAFLATEPADASAVGAAQAYAIYRPLGPVLAIMPWNFPLWQATSGCSSTRRTCRRRRCSWRSCSAAPVSPRAASRRC